MRTPGTAADPRHRSRLPVASTATEQDATNRDEVDDKSVKGLVGLLIAYADYDRDLNTLLGEKDDVNIGLLSDELSNLIMNDDEEISGRTVGEMLNANVGKQISLIQTLGTQTPLARRYERMCARATGQSEKLNPENLDEWIQLSDALDEMLSDVFSHLNKELDDENIKQIFRTKFSVDTK